MSAPDAFSHDRYLVDQLVRPIVNLYRITPLAAGEMPAGSPVAFVRQKKMAIKEDIRFFEDESERVELFRIKARSMFDIGGARYDVTDAQGAAIGERLIGHLNRKFQLRDTYVLDLAGDHERKVDRAVALAIVLDALQSR